MRKLDVLIATHGADGLQRVAEMGLPKIEGVTYVVSWQMAPDSYNIPEVLSRDDVEIYITPTCGLSRNRNNGIAHSRAEICLVADNDLKYTPEGLRAVIDTFDANPQVDLAVFRYDGDRKRYPSAETDISRKLPKDMYVSSVELAFRRERVQGRIEFKTRFGVGAEFPSGEENIFFVDCQRSGLNCRFFPITIVTHQGETTGSRAVADYGVVVAEGVVIRHTYGLKGAPRVPLYVWRNWRRGRLRLWRGLLSAMRGFLFVKIR